jgi:hypothetical protein
MPAIPFADSFLAGSLLSLLMPVLLLIAIVVWYLIAIRRVPGERSDRDPTAEPRGAEQPAVGGDGGTGASGSNP